MISTAGAGWALYDKSKRRMIICRQLVILCDVLIRDFMCRATPINLLLFETIETYDLHELSFIKEENIISDVPVRTSLPAGVDKEVSSFFSSLGKSDIQTQLVLINNFRDYISLEEEEYKISHTKNSRLYLTFGVFSGLLISLVFV